MLIAKRGSNSSSSIAVEFALTEAAELAVAVEIECVHGAVAVAFDACVNDAVVAAVEVTTAVVENRSSRW